MRGFQSPILTHMHSSPASVLAIGTSPSNHAPSMLPTIDVTLAAALRRGAFFTGGTQGPVVTC